jgi:NTP pyrophosphatase (non-canonical NTP hydrolase)
LFAQKHRYRRATTENPRPTELDREAPVVLARSMDLAHLTARAMEVHARFARAALAENRRPWSREEIMQGFVGDVGDLMKLVMAKNGLRSADDLDEKLAHELADCLWSVLTLAKLYDVDLEPAFLSTMNAIEAKLAAENAGKP